MIRLRGAELEGKRRKRWDGWIAGGSGGVKVGPSRQVIRMVFVPPDSYLCRRPILLGVT